MARCGRRPCATMAPVTIRVLIAHDQDVVRRGVRRILESQADMEVVGEAADGVAALDLAGQLRPDVLLVDIRVPKTDGREVTAGLAGRAHPIRYAWL